MPMCTNDVWGRGVGGGGVVGRGGIKSQSVKAVKLVKKLNLVYSNQR